MVRLGIGAYFTLFSVKLPIMPAENGRLAISADLGLLCTPATLRYVYPDLADRPIEAAAWKTAKWFLGKAEQEGMRVQGLHWKIGPVEGNRELVDKGKVYLADKMMMSLEEAMALVAQGVCGLEYLLMHVPAVIANHKKIVELASKYSKVKIRVEGDIRISGGMGAGEDAVKGLVMEGVDASLTEDYGHVGQMLNLGDPKKLSDIALQEAQEYLAMRDYNGRQMELNMHFPIREMGLDGVGRRRVRKWQEFFGQSPQVGVVLENQPAGLGMIWLVGRRLRKHARETKLALQRIEPVLQVLR